MSIYSDTDRGANFRQYKTYAWSPRWYKHVFKNPDFDNDIVESNIQLRVMSELSQRGMILDTAQPDVIIDYDIMTEKKVRQEDQPIYGTNQQVYYRRNNYNMNYNYNYSNMNNYATNNYTYVVGYKTVNIPYQEGTLLIDVIDFKTNRLVWKGYAVGEVDDPSSFESELPIDIHKMFKEYPISIIKVKK